eukprot:c19051_g1_i1 orf=401-640(+)
MTHARSRISIKQYKVIATSFEKGSLYKLNSQPTVVNAFYVTSSTSSELWHACFGHLNLIYLTFMKKDIVWDIPSIVIAT